MKIETPLHTDHQLDQLAGQFEHWRQTRSHRGARIPQALWDQAVVLARVLPHIRVAQHLRLSPNDLKKQMAMQTDLHAAPGRNRKLVAMKGFHHRDGSQAAFLTGLAHLYNLIPYQRRAKNADMCGVEVEGGHVPTSDWMMNLQILTSGGYRPAGLGTTT